MSKQKYAIILRLFFQKHINFHHSFHSDKVHECLCTQDKITPPIKKILILEMRIFNVLSLTKFYQTKQSATNMVNQKSRCFLRTNR